MKVCLSDGELLERYRDSGELRFAGELYERYTHLISVLCMKYLKNRADSEDAAMDIFEVLVRDLRSHEVKNFKAWLYQVTKNHCFKRLRKTRNEEEKVKELKKSDLFFMEYCNSSDLVEEEQLRAGRLAKLEKGLETLSDEQRKCIDMFYIEEKSYKEVSEQTGFTMKEVKSYIQNGKRNLANHIMAKNE